MSVLLDATKLPEKYKTLLTISRRSLCSSLTMKMVSKRDRIVGIKSMFSSPLLSSHRPKTELAAANTAQREFSVVVMPAFEKRTIYVNFLEVSLFYS